MIFPWSEYPGFFGEGPSCYLTVAIPNVLASAGARSAFVPPEGGNVLLDYWVRNDSSATYDNVLVSVDLRLPDGSRSDPLAGPLTLQSLVPGRELRGARSFAIPGAFPPGSYALNLRLGPPVKRVGSVCFRKLP
jgi:hypothetical protein